MIPYQIPDAQKERKRKKEIKKEEHGRLFARKKIKKERMEKNSKIDLILNS